jgi:hypothetical protein
MPPTPHETLMQAGAAWLLSRSLHAVAALGVADALEDEPRPAAELARETGAHAGALERTLRLLSRHGIFAREGGGFSHTEISRLLRADHPHSLRAFVRMLGLPINEAAYRDFVHSLLTGRPAVEAAAPDGWFPYMVAHPEEARIFGQAMTDKSHGHVAGILGAYDFSRFRVIGDIGGGRGHLLSAVLERAPSARGVLFDLPHVIREVAELESPRLALQAGDFFQDPLPACELYLVMEVIHDWDDERAAAILSGIRRAAPDGARLLVIEQVVSDGPGPDWAQTLDVLMLVVTGGLQRTAAEYEALLAASGFGLERVIDTAAGISIVEAVAHPAAAGAEGPAASSSAPRR